MSTHRVLTLVSLTTRPDRGGQDWSLLHTERRVVVEGELARAAVVGLTGSRGWKLGQAREGGGCSGEGGGGAAGWHSVLPRQRILCGA